MFSSHKPCDRQRGEVSWVSWRCRKEEEKGKELEGKGQDTVGEGKIPVGKAVKGGC